MKHLSFRSIRHEILFYGAIALIIVSAAIIGYASISLYSISVEGSLNTVQAVSEEKSGELKEIIDQAFIIDRTLANAVIGAQGSGNKPSREEFQGMVRGLMLAYPEYNGVFIVLEPDAWEGDDSVFRGKPGTDDSGRFMAYYSRDSAGKPLLDKVYAYNPGESGNEYYQVPKKTGKEYVTQPYLWEIQGREILLSSIVTPILINNEFFGISGVDVPLEKVQGLADTLDIYKNSGKAYFISYDGIVTGATEYPESVGKPLKDADIPLSENAEEVIAHIQSGKHTVFEQHGNFVAYTPIFTGNSDQPWSVIFTVPVQVATEQARMNTIILVFIGSIFTAIGLILLYIAAKGITRPIEQISVYADSIAQGELGDEITITRRDEIGRLADSFRGMLSSLQGKAMAADGIAAGDLNVTIPVASDRDMLGRSMVKMRDTISQMSSQVTDLSHRAAAGDLSVRGDTGSFQGEYQEIIRSVNETIEAVVSPINGAMALADVYASGDYTGEFNPDIPVSGAFISFRDSLNHIGKETATSVRRVKDEIESVVGSIEETNASIEEVSSGSSRLAESSNEVSALAETSLNGVNQILQAMNDLSVNISHVAEMTDKVASVSHTTDHLSTKGAELAKQAEEGMQNIISSIEESSRTMNEMSDQMQQIGQIVRLISEISDQTNLLALNAAIEAARAGEAGRGFAVVADEVKSLAIESQISAEKIATMIQTLQKQSSTATEAMHRSSDEVSSGNAAVNDTLQVFSEIIVHIQEISENTASVAAAAEEQAAAVEEITASVHELEIHVTKTSEEALESAAATEQTSAALNQISQSINQVAIAADQINREMGRFRV
jgi:methyl-accepting chemotaxis protein